MSLTCIMLLLYYIIHIYSHNLTYHTHEHEMPITIHVFALADLFITFYILYYKLFLLILLFDYKFCLFSTLK